MEKYDISIIIPVYNVPEDYLRRCLTSVCNQTVEGLEIIVVDDGSKYECAKICDEFADSDKKITVIHKANGGLSAARNTGYKNAHGKWIMFVDGDDWIDPDMCKCMYEVADKNNVQLVMCGMVKEYGKASEKYHYNLEAGKVYTGEECKWLQEQLLHYNSSIAVAYCKLISRDLLEKHNILHDEKLRQGAEGLEFNIRLFEYLDKAIFVDKYFYHYIYNDESISASHNEKNHEYVVKCFEKIKEFILLSENKERLLHWFNNRLLYVIITTAITGYFSPTNSEAFSIKREKYKKYLNNDIIHDALYSKDYQEISKSRRLTLFFIKHNMYWSVSVLAYIRKWQKSHR